jgi:predicted O-methyltransferase YrrM
MQPIHLRNIPPPMETFNHTALFSFLFSYIRPEKYLELGVRSGENFLELSKFCTNSIGVDIVSPQIHLPKNSSFYKMTTDEYFLTLNKEDVFDAIFIDADHSHEQSLKDLLNSRNRVVEDGFIFMHDTYPYAKHMTVPQYCNDVYKTALFAKNNFLDDFEVLTLPINPGVTILKKIDRNKQMIYEI